MKAAVLYTLKAEVENDRRHVGSNPEVLAAPTNLRFAATRPLPLSAKRLKNLVTGYSFLAPISSLIIKF